jgi:MFS transporter, ACS family, 4-hydroxyphenylacetate permease
LASISSASADPSLSTAEESAVQKAAVHLIPLLVLSYILAQIDRVNLGFASLTMNAELGLTATMYGFANTGFFLMYVAWEVPSNLMLARFGARIWIPRIMITWGLVTVATMFVVGPKSLYAVRALLGVAEAGLFPGIMFILASWFPNRRRAEMTSLFLIALPLALVIGAPIAGFILQLDGALGLKGWQWLFLFEGIPPVLVGIATYFILPEKPASVSWLDAAEKSALITRLETEYAENRTESKIKGPIQTLRGAFNIPVLALGLTFFAASTSLNTISVWTPLIVKDVLRTGSSVLLISLVSALPPLAGAISMVLVGRHSDRTKERFWHLIGAILVAIIGWLLCSSPTSPVYKVIGLAMSAAGVYSSQAVFWPIATSLLERRSHAAGMAIIATMGSASSLVNSVLLGVLRDWTGSFNVGMWYAAAVLLVGIALILLVVVPRSRIAGNARTSS